MRDRASVDSELIAVRRLPYGRARTLAAERIVAEVAAEGPQACRAFAGLVLLESYHHAGEALKALVPFTQVLRLADEQPDLLDEGDWQMFLWAFKWLLVDVMENPDVPVSRVDELVADMARRYAVAGVGDDAVAYVRSRWADARESPDAGAVFEAWVSTPRDDFSQCEVCDPGDRAAHLLTSGRQAEAVRLMEEAVATGRTCLSEPTEMLSRLSLAYLELGRDAEAVTAHRRTLSHLESAEVDLGTVRGRVLQFLARAGAVDAVVRRVEADQRMLLGTSMLAMEHLGVLVEVGGAARLLAGLAPAARLRLTAVPVSTFAELDLWCRRRADGLARRFDARYGDRHVSRWVEEAWVLAPHPLDLAVLDAAALDAPAQEPGGLASSAPGAGAPVALVDGGSAGRPGAAALLDEAEAAAATATWERAAPLYLAAGARYVEDGLLLDAGFAFAEAARCAQVLEDLDGAHRAYRRATALLGAGGASAQLIGPVLRAWAPTADAHGEGDVLVDLIDRARKGLAEDGDDDPDGAPDARRRRARRLEQAQLEDTAARLVASLGRAQEALDRALIAAEGFADLGSSFDAAHAAWLVGRLQRDLGRPAAAVPALQEAAGWFERAHDGRMRATVADDLVAVLHALGRHAEADRAAADLLH